HSWKALRVVDQGFDQAGWILQGTAPHRSYPFSRVMRLAQDGARMHGHSGKELRMPQCRQPGHARASRQTSHVDSTCIQLVTHNHGTNKVGDGVSLGKAMCGIWLKPAPTTQSLYAPRLLRIDHHKPLA